MKTKLVISVLLVMFVATIICSSVKAQEPVTPQSLLRDLKETIKAGDDHLFRGYIMTNTRQLKNALARKIDAAIEMLDRMLIEPCRNKLRNDIAPKLAICDTTHVRAQSWLYVYPESTPEYRAVQSFAAECQEIIDSILMDQPK